jgi:hypothetical protein
MGYFDAKFQLPIIVNLSSFRPHPKNGQFDLG